MLSSAMRSVRACLQIFTTAAAILLLASGSIVHAAPPAGSITYVGTDSNISTATHSARRQMHHMQAAAIHVRREDAITPVTLTDDAPDAGPAAGGTVYGWPTFSPDGRRIAYSSETHKQAEIRSRCGFTISRTAMRC